VSPPGTKLCLIPHGEGRSTAEAIRHDAEGAREQFGDAFGDYLATVIGDPPFLAATKFWHTGSYPATEAMDGIEAVSGWIQGTVDAPLEGLGTALGLSPAEAAFNAGVATNFILAPVTGPLGKAESYIGIGAVVFGLVTGGHGLVLACIKPLLHQQLHHALARAVIAAFGGPRKDHPSADRHKAQGHAARIPSGPPQATPRQDLIRPTPCQHEQQSSMPRPAHFPVPQDTSEMRHQPEPREPLWLCLAFAPKPAPGPDTAPAASIRTTAEHEATKPVVLPVSDDAFLGPLSTVLRRGSITEVDISTAQTLSDPPPGRHFVIKLEGFGTVRAQHSSQTVSQHPGCRTGRCVSLGSPPCLCPCDVCRSHRPS
jgi:hypothetical protein